MVGVVELRFPILVSLHSCCAEELQPIKCILAQDALVNVVGSKESWVPAQESFSSPRSIARVIVSGSHEFEQNFYKLFPMYHIKLKQNPEVQNSPKSIEVRSPWYPVIWRGHGSLLVKLTNS
ncbi:hypothetical protein TNCV_4358101 [Trichonephila clavipes]|nr:hypothetical protein TNCV_4358101 [Trichonephila clavipes]